MTIHSTPHAQTAMLAQVAVICRRADLADTQAAYDRARLLQQSRRAADILPHLRAARHALLKAELEVGRG